MNLKIQNDLYFKTERVYIQAKEIMIRRRKNQSACPMVDLSLSQVSVSYTIAR
jgi:hypothetical protein